MKGNHNYVDLFFVGNLLAYNLIKIHIMNKIILLLVFFIAHSANAQPIDYNTKKGYAVDGYDTVAYFDNQAQSGSTKYITTYDGVKYKFLNQENLDKFNSEPIKYIPQYGGYCAYAIAVVGKKVTVDPETYEIRDGKLYLFYNSWGNNTLESWREESPHVLKPKADKNWEKIKNK